VGEAYIGQNRVHVGVIRDITKRKAIEEKMRELAVTDNLTGALNRHGFEEIAENAFMVSKRYSRPLSILMIDADHFKDINDNYGHDAGDRVLIRFSSVVNKTLRSTDVLCRYGGEEFLALLPETTFEEAAILADRLLSALRTTEVRIGDHKTVRFTVSIGVASLTPEVQDLASVIQRADEALYKAKKEGRDRWCAG
jgi:diguanylate cyclase (GGDEF)-like protein